MDYIQYFVYREKYKLLFYKGKSLLEWAKIWFQTSDDGFFQCYGFNFNPHKYPMLYEIARKEVFG